MEQRIKPVHDFHTTRRIEFSDVDLAGFVHFSRFFIFMETAEHEFLQTLGTSVHTMHNGEQIGWPRLKVSCEYVTPARFEDTLDIHLVVARKGKKSMTYRFTFQRGKEVVARGEVTTACCVIESSQLRSIPIPDFIAERIDVSI